MITRSSISASGVPTGKSSERGAVLGDFAIASGRSCSVSVSPRREHDGALDHVLELAHVARPRVVEHALERGARDGEARLAVLLRVEPDEVIDEQRDVLAARAQRRRRDGDDVEPIVEVLAEAPRLHLGEQIAVGRGDDADVGLDGVAAERLVLALLQDAQELHLHLRRELADLVEEERAAGGLREAAVLLRDGAGERAALVAEELALEDRLGDRRAVHGDERARARARSCSWM